MKPPSMPLREFLIKQVAAELQFPVETVHAIVSFQGEDAAKAAHTNNEIEFSGFGKFFISKPRLNKNLSNLEKYMERDMPEEKRKEMEQVLQRFKRREENLYE